MSEIDVRAAAEPLDSIGLKAVAGAAAAALVLAAPFSCRICRWRTVATFSCAIMTGFARR